ncbi:hypothetical protein [Saccharomonospora xinjiangensis]|uniref:hypothetical protein n=1 Tax=Saccharomonospora xinjiangensis TaxID=75294 RepID=UPI00142F410B|nr:hypothetical protein [Saccharomonospora xinjiangensis]
MRDALGSAVVAVVVAAPARPWAAHEVDVAGLVWMLLGPAILGVSFGYARRFSSPLGITAAPREPPPLPPSPTFWPRARW